MSKKGKQQVGVHPAVWGIGNAHNMGQTFVGSNNYHLGISGEKKVEKKMVGK